MDKKCWIPDPLFGDARMLRGFIRDEKVRIYCDVCDAYYAPAEYYEHSTGRKNSAGALWRFMDDDTELWGYCEERTGRVLIEPRWACARDFSEGLAAVQADGRWQFINERGRVKWPGEYYEEVLPFFREGFNAAKQSGKWGVIDRFGRTAVPFEWDDIVNFDAPHSRYFPKPEKWNRKRWNKGYLSFALLKGDKCGFFAAESGLSIQAIESSLIDISQFERTQLRIWRAYGENRRLKSVSLR